MPSAATGNIHTAHGRFLVRILVLAWAPRGSSDRDFASPGLLGVRWEGPAGGSTWGGPAAHQRPADGGATYDYRWWVPGGDFLKSE